MYEQNNYFNKNEIIETNFRTKFFCSDENKIEINVKIKGIYELMIITSQKLANIYLKIINCLFEINPNLIFQFGSKKNCFYFSKKIIDISNKIKQHEAFWIYFQQSTLKIQLSISIKNSLIKFYQNNLEKFNFLMNTNEKQFTKILDGKEIPNRKHFNKI